MCGIAGCFGIQDEKTVDRMLDAMTHRGPDDRGIHKHRCGVFGHTRLSIVDVAGGHQPILANGGEAGIICNGEIYNFREHRNWLRAKYRFKTKSDSEVALHLYREKGPESVKELDGMFAFVIFDGDNYLLARDPIGIKPLYYGYVDERLYFASELGAMSLAGVELVHEFPAGHYYTPREGFVQYYSVPQVQEHLITNFEEASHLIGKTLTRSVKNGSWQTKKFTWGPSAVVVWIAVW